MSPRQPLSSRYTPLGYRNAPKGWGTSLVADPDRAPLVIRAFEEMATGRFTKMEILARLNSSGLRSRRGQPISPQTLTSMPQNRLYMGEVASADFRRFAPRRLRAAGV